MVMLSSEASPFSQPEGTVIELRMQNRRIKKKSSFFWNFYQLPTALLLEQT